MLKQSIVAGAFLVLASTAAAAETPPTKPSSLASSSEEILYSFPDTANSPEDPEAGVTVDKAGNLYGTTQVGGNGGHGVVFRLTPPTSSDGTWTYTALHQFTGSDDGGNPYDAVIFDKAGNLYGTTAVGGSDGEGVVFKLSPTKSGNGPWPETLLYTFTGGTDGALPFGNIAFSTSGSIYGMTVSGGGEGCGTAYELTPPATGQNTWTLTVIHPFAVASDTDGCNPFSGVTLDKHGAIYGDTFGGGTNQSGTAVKLIPSANGTWTEDVLYNFTGENEPTGSMAIDSSGAVYGTTTLGGSFGFGLVYMLTPPVHKSRPWKFRALHQFTSGGDGANPIGGLTLGNAGTIFGAAYDGGLLPTGNLDCFGLSDPLFGNYQGSSSGCGTVFMLSPVNGKMKFTTIYRFRPSAILTQGDGNGPDSALTVDSSGAVYGATTGGGFIGGTVFKITP